MYFIAVKKTRQPSVRGGVSFVILTKCDSKGVLFLSKLVYKRVRSCTSGRSTAPPPPPPPAGVHQMEPPSPIQTPGAIPFPSRFIIRTVPRGAFARRRWEEPISTTKYHCYCTSPNNRKLGVDRSNTIVS